MSVPVPKGEKVIGATFKENHVWYLTRPMREGEQPETATFREVSNYGMLQGTVIFNESK